jgi:hypothetical protein
MSLSFPQKGPGKFGITPLYVIAGDLKKCAAIQVLDCFIAAFFAIIGHKRTF